MRALRMGFVMFLLGLTPVLMGCAERGPTVVSGEAMGSRYHITLSDGHVDAAAIDKEIEALLDSIEVEASQWRKSSWVSRFNRSKEIGPVAVPGHVWAMMVIADRVYRQSRGAFDMTAGPLIELWGFGAKPHRDPPSEFQIAETLMNCGNDKLSLNPEDQTVSKDVPGIQIDLSGLAKGYAIDQIAKLLDRKGITDYLIAFGGEVRARGNGPSKDGWVIHVDSPVSSQLLSVKRVTLRDQSIATSGGSEQNRTLNDGQTVTHLIDPRTGKPLIDKTQSVTVIADSAVLADAWATALSVVPKPDRDGLAKRAGVLQVRSE